MNANAELLELCLNAGDTHEAHQNFVRGPFYQAHKESRPRPDLLQAGLATPPRLADLPVAVRYGSGDQNQVESRQVKKKT